MVKSFMDLFDVLFPLNIGPLTYRRPSPQTQLSRGMIVKAEVKKSLQYGIVLGRAVGRPEGRIKEIAEIISGGPAVSDTFLRLLKWMADYYLVPEGAALKTAALMEFCRPAQTRRNRRSVPERLPSSSLRAQLPPVSQRLLSPIRASLERREYRTYLLHAPSIRSEISSLLAVMEGLAHVIILVPEITHIELLSPLLAESYGSRLAVLHGKLSKAERRNVLGRILSGTSDVVLGTRIAVTAPLPSVSLIAVMQEQNQSFKNLEGVRYHARDVAVMRGYLERSAVVLSSTVPSVESFLNTERAKYVLLSDHEAAQRPRVEILNMATTGKVAPYFSRRAFQAASAAIKGREGVLFFVNRKGYSLIQCAECSTVFACPECRIPLIYHKSHMVLRCHYCSYSRQAPDTCEKCGSMKLEAVGAGTQRIAADVRKYFDREPFRIDKDALREESIEGLRDILQGNEIVVGTKAVKACLDKGPRHRLCVFMNPDIGLHMPDFRSAELLFQEIIGMTEYVDQKGLIIIQTKMPENHVFRCVKGYDFREFYRRELAMRKALSYPPFSRMIVLTFFSKTDMGAALMRAFPSTDGSIECIGPIPASKRRTHVWKVILKSALKERLSRYARIALEVLREEKGLRVVVDVDPIAV